MSNRPHFINGDEVFVKRTLPRSTSTIPERLIVTNRLILQDLHQHDKRSLRTYFQKFGSIKKFDIEHGFIDYEVSHFSKISDLKVLFFFCLRIMTILIVFYLLVHIIYMIEKFS